MLLSEPGQTPYDLRFTLFGFPVRIHPLFFVAPLLFLNMAFGGPLNAGVALLVAEAVFFVSILTHELGHAFAMRYYGSGAEIVLYLMGGFATPGNNFASWRGGGNRSFTPKSQIVISLAGPFAGFLLGAVLVGIGLALGGRVMFVPFFQVIPVPFLLPSLEDPNHSAALWMFLLLGVWVNFFWGLFNLLPIYPLDGGQVSRQMFILSDPWNGLRKSLILSLIVATLIAVLGLRGGLTWCGIMMGFMAFSNYQELAMATGGRGRPW